MHDRHRVLLTLLASWMVVGAVCLALYSEDAREVDLAIRERESSRVALFARLFGQDLRAVTTDLRILTQTDAVQEYIAADGAGPRARLTREMASFSRNCENYDQVRLLDASGQERVRVNLGGVIAPDAELQNKASRPYFREAAELPVGNIYVSAFDLNVENGVVEKPFKPMLRFAAPVFDGGGGRFGVMVINVLGKPILDSFREFDPLSKERLRLLNGDGFWLQGGNSEDEWGFMLPNRAERTLARTSPALWKEVTARDMGQSRRLGGLFTWQRVSSAEIIRLAGVTGAAGDSQFVFASDVAADAWAREFSRLKQLHTVVAAILFVIATVGTSLFIGRKRARERLHSADELNTTIIHAANVAVISTSTDGVITGFNPRAERLLDWPAGELIGKRTVAAFHDPQEVAPGSDVFALESRRSGREEGEWTFIRRDGERIPVSLSVSVLRDSHGIVTGYLGVASDMTERKRAEEALRDARTAAEESARLKSQFLANMSHEIRTPMNGVIGMIEVLLDTDLTDDQRSIVDTVRTSADSLLTIINDILDFSKIEAGQLQFEALPFDLLDPIEDCLGLMAERAHAKGLEIASFVDENVPLRLVGDAGRIQQVLLNLVGNAVKFTTHGEVVVNVTKHAESGHRARMRFSVSDTGMGLSAEQQARLFQPFVQADASMTRKFGGTGLGLAISKQLIGLMGGEIGIESEPGKGSTFWFTLELPVVAEERDPAQEWVDLAGRRALLVDDNDTNRNILRRQLARWRMDSTTVTDGEGALAALRAAAAAASPYDVVVLDMQMPGMSGIEVAAAVHAEARFADVGMIILTSTGRTLTRRELEDAGVGACLMKPVRRMQLHDTLVGLIRRSAGDAPVGSRRRRRPPVTAPRTDPNLRILVADDNLVNQHVARRLLQKLGCTPDIVEGGSEAVEAVRTRSYDVVFMDCQMPGVDGFEATRCIRRWEAGRRAQGEAVAPLHIVAMTANAMAGDREACLAAGMTDYISKPVHANDLAAAMARSHAATAGSFLGSPR